MRNDQTGSQRLACRFKNGHEGKVIWWKIRDCLTALGVSVQNFLGGSVNLLRNDRTGSQRLACRFENGLEGQVIWWKRRYWLTVLGVLVRKGLGGAGLAGLIGWVDPMGKGQYGRIDGWERAAGTGAPPLYLERIREAGSSGCHQLRWCCKGAEFFSHNSRIIQIGCTQIQTAT